MREGLRSSDLGKGEQVDSGHDVGDLEGGKVPDLNVNGDPDVVLGGEEGKFCYEVSKNNGRANGSLCERGLGEEECKGMEVELGEEKSGFQSLKCSGVNDSERREVGDHDRNLQACSVVATDGEEKFYDCEILGGANVLGGEGKETGVEGLNCAIGAADQVMASSSVALEHVDKDMSLEEVKEMNMQSNSEINDKATSLQGVEICCTDHNQGVSSDKPSFSGVDSDCKMVRRGERVDCDIDNVRSDSGAVIEGDEKVGGIRESDCRFGEDDKGESLRKEAEQGSVQVVGKVLRSRIVPANGKVAGGGQFKVAQWKRKRGTDGLGEVVSTVKEQSDRSAVESVRVRKRGRPKKSIDLSEEEVIQINKVQVVSRAEREDVNSKSVKTRKKKGKRGRPKKSIDRPEEEVLLLNNVPFLSEAEDEELDNKTVRTPRRKGKRGRPRKSMDSPEGKVVQANKFQALSEFEDEGLNNKSVRSSKKKRKRGRPRKSLDCPDGEVDCAADDGKKSVRNSVLERKRGRPRKSVSSPGEEVVQMKKVSFHEVDGEFEYANEELHNRSVRNSKKKRKRGRPRKEERSGILTTFHDKGVMKNDRKMKVSLAAAPVRRSRHDVHPDKMQKAPSNGVPSMKELASDRKASSTGPGVNVVHTPSKDQEKAVAKNILSKKHKKFEKIGSVSAEKNLIRNQIVNMLITAGWKVEYRPRQGRQYNDAVYVNREGKTHWSVTKAYFSLKQEFEEGKLVSVAAKSKSCFTPIPEEILSKLFRVVSKTRSDKNKRKKNKDTDENSDEEDIGDKTGAKPRQRKSSARSGSQNKRRCALLVRRSKNSESDGIIAYSGKHSILAWMIDSGTIPLNGKVHYMNRRKTRAMLEGSITRDGIRCSCCKEVISVSEFEKHAGSRLCEPYENVYLESGSSLLQCQLDSWNRQEEAGRSGFHTVPVDGDDPNDDTCGICGDGGELVCCDGCPSTFHHDCLDVEEVPSGEWHCVYCSCKFCGSVSEATSESDDDCEPLSSSLLSCSLCQEKYHQSCIDDEDVCIKSRQPTFCGRDCQQIFVGLQSLVGAKRDLGDGFSFTLLQRSDVQADTSTLQPQKILSNSKLAVALSIMDECFLPILDHRSGINLIRHIVYSCGSNFKRLNFSSFFTVILEKGDEVISAASIRICGKQLAEMPFIGTRNVYRRQGMCRRLLNAIELALSSLDVENLVIPAIPELLQTWTSVFGFKPLEDIIKEEMRSMSMLVFPHTDMLQKPLSKQQLVQTSIAATEEDLECGESGNAELIECGADKSKVDDGCLNGKPKVDDGCLNGTIDLNSAAPILPESSPDEHDLVHPENKVEGEHKEASLLDPSEDRAEKPDLNMMQESMCEDDVNPNSLKSTFDANAPSHLVSATVNSDQVAKSTSDFPGLIHFEEGQSALGNDRPSVGGRTLKFDLNLVEENVPEISKLPSDLVGH